MNNLQELKGKINQFINKLKDTSDYIIILIVHIVLIPAYIKSSFLYAIGLISTVAWIFYSQEDTIESTDV